MDWTKPIAAQQAAELLGLTDRSVYNLVKQHDPQTGGTRLVRAWPYGEGIGRDVFVTPESLRREMKRRGIATEEGD